MTKKGGKRNDGEDGEHDAGTITDKWDSIEYGGTTYSVRWDEYSWDVEGYGNADLEES